MYDLLIKLMLIAGLAEAGITVAHVESCHSRECIQDIEKASRNVLKIDWQPISVFPEEGRRFK